MTLVEVMTACFVFVIIFLGAISSAMCCTRIVHSAKAKTAATSILNTKIEEFRAMPFADVAKYLPPTTTPHRPANGTFAAGGYKGTYQRSVEKVNNASGLLRATVTVSWTELGHPYSLSAVTYISQYGIVNKATAATQQTPTTPST